MHLLPLAAVALMAGSKVAGGVSALQAGNANKRAAFGQAHEEEAAAAEQELRVRDSTRRAMGQQIAAQWGNGFEGGTGSALDALQESQTNMAIDVLQLRRDATTRAASLRAQGKQAQTQGRFALAEGLLGAASTAIGGMSDWKSAKAPYSAAVGGGGS